MAPPTKYRSHEAKLQANRAKSTRSYEKYFALIFLPNEPDKLTKRHSACRRKDDINRKRREKYRMAKLSLLRGEAEQERTNMSRRIVRTTDETAPFWTSFWLEEAQKQYKIYQANIRGDGRKFAITICEDYLDRAHSDPEGAQSLLEMHREKATRYQKILTDLRDKVLNSAGIGKEFKQIDEMVKGVVEVGIWLDDISVLTLEEGIGGVELAFRNQRFSFQE